MLLRQKLLAGCQLCEPHHAFSVCTWRMASDACLNTDKTGVQANFEPLGVSLQVEAAARDARIAVLLCTKEGKGGADAAGAAPGARRLLKRGRPAYAGSRLSKWSRKMEA